VPDRRKLNGSTVATLQNLSLPLGKKHDVETKAKRTKEKPCHQGCHKGQHRQPPRTKAAMTERDGEPHKVDYTTVGFETRSFFPRVWASHVDRLEDIVYRTSTVESQSQTWQLLQPLSQTTLGGLLTALHQLGCSLHPDRCRQDDQGEHYSTAVG